MRECVRTSLITLIFTITTRWMHLVDYPDYILDDCSTIPYHFVGQDAVDAVLVQADEPVETADLIISHLASSNVCEMNVLYMYDTYYFV